MSFPNCFFCRWQLQSSSLWKGSSNTALATKALCLLHLLPLTPDCCFCQLCCSLRIHPKGLLYDKKSNSRNKDTSLSNNLFSFSNLFGCEALHLWVLKWFPKYVTGAKIASKYLICLDSAKWAEKNIELKVILTVTSARMDAHTTLLHQIQSY